MVSMLSIPPQATRFPLGEKAEVITQADFKGITCTNIKWILMKQFVHLYLVACPAIPNNQFPVQRSANLPNLNFNKERKYIDCPRH